MNRVRPSSAAWLAAAALSLATLVASSPSRGAEADTPYLADRGTGVPTSMFGTYVRRGERLVYTFYEFTANQDQEYKPAELGFSNQHDFRARRTDHEGLLFLAYGLGEDLLIEGESALVSAATQDKAATDPSPQPARLHEQGLGDTEGQLRWRVRRETARAPEVFASFEVVLPLQEDRRLIGTQAWELSPGIGLIKGTRWGTWTTRATASYTPGDGTFEWGETSLEYLKRFTPRWRGVMSIEGEQDEWALIAEAQLHLSPRLVLKLNNGFGLTSKAPDLAPEVGLLFAFPRSTAGGP